MSDTFELVYEQIKEANRRDHIDAIPHSDTFTKKMESVLGMEGHTINKAINVLKEAHKIFTIEITKEDKRKEIKKVVGYVDSDIDTIRRLKHFYQLKLVEEYANAKKNRVPLSEIIREFLKRPSEFTNSQLGQIANKTIMLEEYENLIIKHPEQYSEEWKNDKLSEIVKKFDSSDMPSGGNNPQSAPVAEKALADQEDNRRAVDTDKYHEFEKTSQQMPVQKIIKIYGMEFFLRVSYRKYCFAMLQGLVEKGIIRRKNDLVLMKSMLDKVKSNFAHDVKLFEYENDIKELEKAISAHSLLSHN